MTAESPIHIFSKEEIARLHPGIGTSSEQKMRVTMYNSHEALRTLLEEAKRLIIESCSSYDEGDYRFDKEADFLTKVREAGL